jgi:CheY-like chemotaxis protein
MIRKGVEFTLQLIEPGVWKWRFRIGDVETSGRTHTNLKGLAVRRVEAQIDRALSASKKAGLDGAGSHSADRRPELRAGSTPGAKTLKRILIVDDDPMIRGSVSTWLEQRGFAVVVADGAKAGLDALEGSTFDLMMVDIFMPRMRGFESIRVFHQRSPAVPLIAISGYVFAEERTPDPNFLNMALSFGATRCLRKPFTPSTLLGVIDACLSESEAEGVRVTV